MLVVFVSTEMRSLAGLILALIASLAFVIAIFSAKQSDHLQDLMMSRPGQWTQYGGHSDLRKAPPVYL